jgi:hypothetical protein
MTKDEIKVKFADFFLAVAQLVIGGVLLSSIFDPMTRQNIIVWSVIIIGAILIGALALFWFSVDKSKTKNK